MFLQAMVRENNPKKKSRDFASELSFAKKGNPRAETEDVILSDKDDIAPEI